ncbi:MAG TPA: hypothetical protein VFP11_13310 [Candidatus Angelobacter sp.]|nr:hypothetical protein [Candidatus Angelobacter sp.]
MKVPLQKCQRRLAEIWLAGSGLMFFLILAQTFLDAYKGNVSEAWNWFLPAVLPTASLIVTTLFQTVDAEKKTVDRFLFRLCAIFSLVYFVVLLAVVLATPFENISPVDALKHSHIFLAPLQAIVVGAVAAFFGKAEKAEEDQTHAVASNAAG